MGLHVIRTSPRKKVFHTVCGLEWNLWLQQFATIPTVVILLEMTIYHLLLDFREDGEFSIEEFRS